MQKAYAQQNVLHTEARDAAERPRRESNTHIRPPQKREQLSARHEIHDHVQIREILERAPEVDDEGVLHGEEQSLFVVCVVDLTHPDDFFFVEDFDGVESEVVF